jgi:7,8-dihydroneopterin 2',3'-cyclic phosphate phosphodiesterase
MKDLLKIAEGIGNASLRKRVISTLRNPGKLSGKAFAKYEPCSFEEAPASTSFHHIYIGGLLDHTYSVAKNAICIAKAFEEVYKIDMDYDSLIAAALLHDVGKLWKLKKENDVWDDTGILLDHTMLWTSELYARGFPEKVVHIVASHFGENGPTPPMTIESMILHNVDDFDARMGTMDQESLLQQIIAQVKDDRKD